MLLIGILVLSLAELQYVPAVHVLVFVLEKIDWSPELIHLNISHK